MTDERICHEGHVIDPGQETCSRCGGVEEKQAEEGSTEKSAEGEAKTESEAPADMAGEAEKASE